MQKIKDFKLDFQYGTNFRNFQNLMKIKIRDILLVSSLYDYYLFEEDGRLYEQIREEYRALNLSYAPEITHVTTAKEAFEILQDPNKQIDLIITTLHIEDKTVTRFAEEVKNLYPKIPIILLAYDNKELKELQKTYDTSIFEKIFIWLGDYKLLVAIIKYLEDRLNVENDTKIVGVQSIIVIEDNVKFYSSYLPIIYTEVFTQSQRLISEGLNISHKYLRMKARPKILLCSTYEEGWEYFIKYQEFILGIILDINFKKNGEKIRDAGIQFALEVKKRQHDIPILLQSSNIEWASKAKEIQSFFIQKGSPQLLRLLREFIQDNLGFGDFIFRTADGREVARARNLIEMEEVLKTVPDESIVYHASRNHFSNWLKARTEFWLAHQLRPRKVSDYPTVEDLRQDLIKSIKNYREMRLRGIISEFNKHTFDPDHSFARIGTGSLGGKARGLGFLNNLIVNYGIRNQFENTIIYIPSGVVIATDIFDQFISENSLFDFAIQCDDDKIIKEKFLEAKINSQDVINKLRDFLDIVRTPLAIRSSSLLEDSQFQPLAGVYLTLMIPNNNPDIEIRLQELIDAIKLVYASMFMQHAKNYMRTISFRHEEEKMAVIAQKVVGLERNGRFYPDFAGVGRSFNFYPISPQKSEDGIAQVALGLGKMVVEGGNSVRFCPKYPKHLLQFYSTKETIKNAQQYFYAIDLNEEFRTSHHDLESFVKEFELAKAEEDGALYWLGSTYSPENEEVYDGIAREGSRIVTFAPILKYETFPLAAILDFLLDICSWAMGSAVEIEFACNLNVPAGRPKEFALLQMRPFIVSHEFEEVDFNISNGESFICYSNQVLGNGIYSNLFDIVFVDIEKYDRSKSLEVSREIEYLNQKLFKENRNYILIGVGRWGSFDPWLGIPVTWDQIGAASVIVESSFKDMHITPSQGSHFFQNITTFRIGYFTIDSYHGIGFIDWGFLKSIKPIEELNFTKHLRFNKEIIVKINGKKNQGVIYKP
jgi:CheY-like chemotaxis protein